MDKLLAILLGVLLLIPAPALAARQFVSASTQSLQSTTTVNLTASPKVALSFWLYWDAFANDDKLALEFSSNYNLVTDAFIIDPDESASGTFEVSLHGDVGNSTAHITRPSAGAWHHYVVNLDKSKASNEVDSIYIDGSSQSITYTNNADNTNGFGTYTLNVMSRNNASLFADGRMADLAVYSGVTLSQSDVDALYNTGSGADARTVQGGSLVQYWLLCGSASPEPNLSTTITMTLNNAPTQVAHPITTCAGYILTEITDCINAENADRLIKEEDSVGVGTCVTAAVTAPPMRTLMGVGQ